MYPHLNFSSRVQLIAGYGWMIAMPYFPDSHLGELMYFDSKEWHAPLDSSPMISDQHFNGPGKVKVRM